MKFREIHFLLIIESHFKWKSQFCLVIARINFELNNFNGYFCSKIQCEFCAHIGTVLLHRCNLFHVLLEKTLDSDLVYSVWIPTTVNRITYSLIFLHWCLIYVLSNILRKTFPIKMKTTYEWACALSILKLCLRKDYY